MQELSNRLSEAKSERAIASCHCLRWRARELATAKNSLIQAKLCTILADEAHLDLATAEARMNGSCSIRNGQPKLSAEFPEFFEFSEFFNGSTLFDETINGTPVSLTPQKMVVRLESKPYQGITVSVGYPPPGLDYKAFTERVLAKLVGKG
ncbi:hypothetical protein [Amycolatopsis minnesotensis]|uniref:Uncharacterized protein n=1 Tax=Amycolatopsis minnesotensis TaxID=337894 RepID=A0ABN2QEG6_9PSEU